MKNLTATLIATLAAASLYAAPAPYPVTINSRSQSAPPLPCFRANEHTFRVSFTDGGTASDVTGYIPFLNWSTNSGAAVVSTSSWAFVTATNGTVDFTFDSTAINYPEGRYTYNVGVKTSNGVVRSYSQGVLQIYGSPTASGASAVQWVANVDWNMIVWANLPSYALSSDLTNEAALRASGDVKGTNYTDTVTAGMVTNFGRLGGLTFTNIGSRAWAAPGFLRWDDDEHGLVVDTDTTDSSITLGEEINVRVRNTCGTNILNGQIVKLCQGAGPFVNVTLADNSTLAGSIVFGVATTDIDNNGFGRVTTFGKVRGLVTTGYTEGAIVYLGRNGTITNAAPLYPAYEVAIGVVEYTHGTQGRIFVKPYRNGWIRAGDIPAESDTLQTVVTRGGTVTSGTLTIDAANARTNTYGGLLGIGPSRWQANGGTASGLGSWANGSSTASGPWSWANNGGMASGRGSWAMGSAVASNDFSFAWNDQVSHGTGSFNIGAPSLLWLGGTSLQTLLDGKLGTNGLTAPIIAAGGGLTNVIFSTPISTLSTGAVVTVTPSQSRRVYQVEASVPITLTNNLSALAANCTTNYEWETWINYTDTNALSTVWDSRINWQQQTPDLTVTGLYKFAMSTACGTIIQARQTWPTVYKWEPMIYAGAGGTFNSALMRADFNFASTNYFPLRTLRAEGANLLFSINGIANANKPLTYYLDLGFTAQSNVGTKPTTTGLVFNTSSLVYFAKTNCPALAYIYVENSSPESVASVLYREGLQRCREMNELETAAYNAGWRP
jgi:hypothetical protein